MGHVFSNTDAAVAGGIALVEFFGVFIYLIFNIRSMTREIIDKGRLIPTMMFAGGMPMGQQPYMPAPQQPQPYGFGGPMAPTAPPQGPYATQDNPPTYSEVKEKM